MFLSFVKLKFMFELFYIYIFSINIQHFSIKIRQFYYKLSGLKLYHCYSYLTFELCWLEDLIKSLSKNSEKIVSFDKLYQSFNSAKNWTKLGIILVREIYISRKWRHILIHLLVIQLYLIYIQNLIRYLVR